MNKAQSEDQDVIQDTTQLEMYVLNAHQVNIAGLFLEFQQLELMMDE